jgi:hypothetical protein
MNQQCLLFQKNQRIDSFHEKTDEKLTVRRKVIFFQNFKKIFKNQGSFYTKIESKFFFHLH